ncbi:fused MFS/spermidine synthase [Brevibacterium samyangense]|uniref:Spermidine synthase n=1 Tax=Brevibacterium samyangense TaxID=366888 RepID=A0ABN2TE93_9MICO
MGRKRTNRKDKDSRRSGSSTAEAPAGSGPDLTLHEGEWETDTGTVRLERDRYATNAWTIFVNGVPSSHVDLDDPRALDFEYMRWMAAVISERWGASGGGSARSTAGAGNGDGARLRALHLGGGACSMARWVHATYPDARQVVVELDARLTVLVRAWFDLPSAPLLRLRPGDAGEVLPTLTENSRDLVIRDVFAGDRTPEQLTTVEYARHADRVLDAGGLYLLNVGDTPDLAGFRRESDNLRAVFAHVAAIADAAMLKGRRRGNVVLAASQSPLPLGPSLTRTLLSDPLPAQVREV